ncbi:MAG: DUF3368 domain-containing protein [Ignavibacteria bacterium]|nr:DUF3368 domain-containing protein [Ignavibacteria bacterium]
MFKKFSELKNPLIFDSSSIFNFGHRGNLENLVSELTTRFDLLITKEVFDEVTKNEGYRLFYQKFISNYFTIVKLRDTTTQIKFITDYSEILGKGELSVLTISHLEGGTVIIDEKLARKIAKRLNLKVIGTLGLLYISHKENLITENLLRKTINLLRQNGFRIPELKHNILIDKYFIDLDKD